MKAKEDIIESEVELGDFDNRSKDNSNVINTLNPIDLSNPNEKYGLADFTRQVTDSNIPISKKINDIITYKITLLQPLVQILTSKDTFVDDSRIKYSKELYHLLSDLEGSIYNKTDYENKEEIDFTHPKISKAFEFMVEAVIESLQEAEVDDILINSFINIFSNKMIGFEEELEARMKGVANAALSKVRNPLMEKYRENLNK